MACQPDDAPSAVFTHRVYNITPFSAAVEMESLPSEASNGSNTNIVYYATHPNPTLKDSGIAVSMNYNLGYGLIRNLTPNTTYYVRAYARNSKADKFGNELMFTTPDAASFTDARDGQKHYYVTVGTQAWMVNPMKYRVGPDATTNGDKIYYPYWEACCACPDGWKMPTVSDWEALDVYFGQVAQEYFPDLPLYTGKVLASSLIYIPDYTEGITHVPFNPLGLTLRGRDFWAESSDDSMIFIVAADDSYYNPPANNNIFSFGERIKNSQLTIRNQVHCIKAQ